MILSLIKEFNKNKKREVMSFYKKRLIFLDKIKNYCLDNNLIIEKYISYNYNDDNLFHHDLIYKLGNYEEWRIYYNDDILHIYMNDKKYIYYYDSKNYFEQSNCLDFDDSEDIFECLNKILG